MRKYILTILILSNLTTFLIGQNFVPNPSFENYSFCPPGYGYIDYAIPWGGPTSASSDFFNSCATNTSVDVPNNWDIYGGYQFPRTGNGYAGFLGSCPFDIREYVQVPLIDTLTAGVIYRVTFYVNLSNTERYGIDEIGACITKTAISGTPGYVLNYTPQVYSPTGVFLTDTLEWMEITGTFIATGGEKYLTIGNFNNDINTNQVVVNPTAYDTVSS